MLPTAMPPAYACRAASAAAATAAAATAAAVRRGGRADGDTDARRCRGAGPSIVEIASLRQCDAGTRRTRSFPQRVAVTPPDRKGECIADPKPRSARTARAAWW